MGLGGDALAGVASPGVPVSASGGVDSRLRGAKAGALVGARLARSFSTARRRRDTVSTRTGREQAQFSRW